MPEGGIWHPTRGSKVKTANVAAMNRERMSLTPRRMAFPLLNRRRSRRVFGSF
jgi:hypothetical protein